MTSITEVVTGPALVADPALAVTLREAAIAVLVEAGEPLRAAQIVEAIRARRIALTSTSRTPTQSVNRDLHSAVRRGDARVQPGPLPGQFVATDAHTPHSHSAPVPQVVRRAPAHQCRLPVEPLTDALARRGGLGTGSARGTLDDRRAAALARTMRRSISRGWISLHAADAICILHLGLHPCLVWGGGWWDTLEEIDRQESPKG